VAIQLDGCFVVPTAGSRNGRIGIIADEQPRMSRKNASVRPCLRLRNNLAQIAGGVIVGVSASPSLMNTTMRIFPPPGWLRIRRMWRCEKIRRLAAADRALIVLLSYAAGSPSPCSSLRGWLATIMTCAAR